MNKNTLALCALSIGAAITMAACQQQQQQVKVEPLVVLPLEDK